MFVLFNLQNIFSGRLNFTKLLISVFLLLSSFSQAQIQNGVSIAAAANLHGVLTEIISQYSKNTGQKPRVVYGSSGQLYQQITQGAKFDLFLSANEDFVDRLVSQNYSSQAGVVYSRGRLALVLSPKSGTKIKPEWDDIKKAAKDGRISKFAIANPAIAPYGLAAKQVLEKQELLTSLQALLVFGGDVGQTMLFLQSEAAQVGLVPLSMVKQPSSSTENAYLVVDEKLHQPILQKMLLFKFSSSQAMDFYYYLQSAEARHIWRKFGYE